MSPTDTGSTTSPRPPALEPERSRDRVGPRGVALDAVVAVVLSGLVTAGNVSQHQLSTHVEIVPSPTPVTFVGGLLMCLPLALRRRYPFTVLLVVAGAFTVYGYNGGSDGLTASVAVFLAILAAGSHGRPDRRDAVRGVVVVALMGTAVHAMLSASIEDVPLFLTWIGQGYLLALNLVFFVVAWVLGDQLRLRREREADLRERTAELAARTIELEVERERSAQQATVAERLRIARELHDVLGQHVSVMGVQAAAAQRVLDRDPGRARDALAAIEGSSRQAVEELQRVLTLLREEGDDAVVAAELDRLDDLASEFRRAGLTVAVQVDVAEQLPVEIDLATVRVVQEALTNVLRHAGPGSSAWVKVVTVDGDRQLDIEVDDDGRGSPAADLRAPDDAGTSRGTGLTGMRERVELHGGEFHAGPAPPRGWRVRARIPLPVGTAGRERTRATVGGPRHSPHQEGSAS